MLGACRFRISQSKNLKVASPSVQVQQCTNEDRRVGTTQRASCVDVWCRDYALSFSSIDRKNVD